METGQRGATARDIRDLCDLYGVTDEGERTRLTALAAGGKQQSWWQGFELDYFSTYVGLEEEATLLNYYQSAVVPGLLQTPAYARALHEIAVPAVPAERIEQLIEVRVTRQRRLFEEPLLQVCAVLDEAVLHRVVGGPDVMRDQLARLTELAGLPHVTIQVIPFSAGAHPALESTFNILNFNESSTNVVYIEGLHGFFYLERPQDISRYEAVFERLGAIAMTPRESIELISKMGIKYGNTVPSSLM